MRLFSKNILGCPASDGVPAIVELPSGPWQAPQTANLALTSCAKESGVTNERMTPVSNAAIDIDLTKTEAYLR